MFLFAGEGLTSPKPAAEERAQLALSHLASMSQWSWCRFDETIGLNYVKFDSSRKYQEHSTSFGGR